MKRFKVALEESAVERLREAARRRAFVQKTDLSWQDLLRTAAEQFLAAETILETTGATMTNQKGTR